MRGHFLHYLFAKEWEIKWIHRIQFLFFWNHMCTECDSIVMPTNIYGILLQVYLGEQYVNNPTLSDVTFLVEGREFCHNLKISRCISLLHSHLDIFCFCSIARKTVLCTQNLFACFFRCISSNVRWWLSGEHAVEFLLLHFSVWLVSSFFHDCYLASLGVHIFYCRGVWIHFVDH